jgi:hypothetical protein
MDLINAGSGQDHVGRTAAFGQGSGGNPYRVASSLQQDSANYQDEVGSGFTPTSVLNQTVGSGNGMSSGDYTSRTLSNGSLLPTENGMAGNTHQGIAKMLLDGQRQIGIL